MCVFFRFVPSLLARQAGQLRARTRIVHLGYGNFREDHRRFEQLLAGLAVPHVFRDGPQREHTWGSGWLPEAVQLLLDPQR